jgi:hypothetical protein
MPLPLLYYLRSYFRTFCVKKSLNIFVSRKAAKIAKENEKKIVFNLVVLASLRENFFVPACPA